MEKRIHRGNLEKTLPSTLIPDIIRGGYTGVLTLEDPARRKSLYFRQGSTIYAESSDPGDRLGQVLLRGGRITEEKLKRALRLQQGSSAGKILGAILVQMDFMQPRDLVWGVKAQVEGIFCDCYHWREGLFIFQEEEDPTAWKVIVLELSMVELLRAALGRAADPERLLGLLGDFDRRVDPTPGWRERAGSLELLAGELEIAALADTGADRVGRLLLASPQPAADTARSLLLLHGLGLLTLG
jgi:hypothetical protein